MAYSHRYYRVHRSIFRTAAVGLALVPALVALAFFAPPGFLAWLGISGLAVLGAAVLSHGQRLTRAYAADVGRMRSGAPVDGYVRAELEAGAADTLPGLPANHHRSTPRPRVLPGERPGP